MPKSIKETVMLDLTNAGSRAVIPVAGVDVASFSTPFASLMGSAVIEIKKRVGGVEESYSPAKQITSSVASVTMLDVDGIDEIVLVVTTADSSQADVPVNAYAEETQ